MIETVRIGCSHRDLERAARALRDGELVVFPTDTVYGVGAHAYLPAAVQGLYAAKDRPADKAIPLLISGLDALPQVAREIPATARALAALYWPGALTLVLRRAPAVSDAVTAGGDTVAVRAPDHPVALALIAALGAPVAATSANLSGQPAPTTASGALGQLEGRVHLVVDGGACPGGVASTVLDLTIHPPRILRQGGIAAHDIAAVIGRVE